MKENELKEIAGNIIDYLTLTDDKDKIYAFLRDLLSEKEILEFSRRFEVAKSLNDKISYTEIEKKTKMSSTTIARISKFLYCGNNGYLDAISKLKSVANKHHEVHQS